MIRRLIEALPKKDPHPPPADPVAFLAKLPTPQGKWVPSGGTHPRQAVTLPRIATPPALAQARARAARLSRRRQPRLGRPELHQHQHSGTPGLSLAETIAAAAGYITGTTPDPPALDVLAPYQRAALVEALDRIAPTIATHQWAKSWRLDDLRRATSIE